MTEILSDVKDVYAERKKESMISIVKDHLLQHPEYSNPEFHAMLRTLNLWNSNYDKDMFEPTYFTLWEYFFRKNYLSEQLENNALRMVVLSNTFYESRYNILFDKVAQNPSYQGKIFL